MSNAYNDRLSGMPPPDSSTYSPIPESAVREVSKSRGSTWSENNHHAIEDRKQMQKDASVRTLQNDHGRITGRKHGEQKYRFKNLESTTFDAFLYSTCSVIDTSLSYEKGVWLQFIFAISLQSVTVVIQVGLVVLLYSTAVEEMEWPYEHGLQDKIAAITDALAQNAKLDKNNATVELCRKDHTLLGVHIMVLWIWISRMLREIISGLELVRIFWSVDSPTTSDDPEQRCTLRYLKNGHLCEPMTKARFLKQGKPKSLSDKEFYMSNTEYWEQAMEIVVDADAVEIKATELRKDLNGLWSGGNPMTLPDLYDEMEGVVNGFAADERPTFEEFQKELGRLWTQLEQLPYNAVEIIDEDVVLDGSGELVKESYSILYLTPLLRWTFIIFHGGLRTVLSVGLTFASSKFLILSNDMSTVILKAVSMQFIVTLDALLFKAFIPTTFAKKIKCCRIVYAGERPTETYQYSKSVVYVIVAIVATFVIRNILFIDMQEFRAACRDYYTAYPEERNIPMDLLSAVLKAFRCTFSWAMPPKP